MDKEGLLVYFSKITPRRLRDLELCFQSLDAAWNAPDKALRELSWDKLVLEEFIDWRRSVDENKIKAELVKHGIECVAVRRATYPTLLRQIYDPPAALFVRGRLPDANRPAVAVVGTRQFSDYGRSAVEKIVPALARAGVVIVSGLAYGIDSLAHEAALEAGGLTVAVLGTGIDDRTICPRSRRTLATEIIKKGGAVISEYPPGTAATAYSFPTRNRIIAGLALATVVVEAPEKSGALITANFALHENRDVLAVPHPITSLTGVGTNWLIKQGARLVESSADVLEAIGLSKPAAHATNNPLPPLPPLEAKIFSLLTSEPTHIDEIIKTTGLASAAILGSLTLLEAKGHAKNLGGMRYVRG